MNSRSKSASQSDNKVITVSVIKIAKIWNPFTNVIWQQHLETPITKEEVRLAIENKSLLAVEFAETIVQEADVRARHVSRIAWFVENIDSEEAKTPIDIDFGVPGHSQTYFEICDGNHRFAAHLYCNKPTIQATWSGALSEATLFSSDDK